MRPARFRSAAVLAAMTAIALASVSVFAQQPQSSTTVRGHVLDSRTGRPLDNVAITLSALSPGSGQFAATTDTEGRFSVPDVDSGRYRLTADRRDFIKQVYGATRASALGTVISVRSGNVVDVSMSLVPQSIISGRVFDEHGEPIVGVPVQLLQRQYFFGRRRLLPAPAPPAVTDDRGEFRIAGLHAGKYFLVASAQQAARPQAGLARTKRSGGEETGYVMTYYPNVDDAQVASPVDLPPGLEASNIDITLRQEPVHRISGTLVIDARQPSRKATLALLRVEGDGMSTLPVRTYNADNPGGVFELRGVPRGRYELVAQIQSTVPMLATMPIDVADMDVDNVMLAIGAATDVPVSIRVAGDSRPDKTALNPAAGVAVSIRPEANPFLVVGMSPDEVGSGVIKQANAGKYRLIVGNIPATLYLKSAMFGDHDALADDLELLPMSQTRLQVVLGNDPATIQGVAVNSKGERIIGAVVTLVPDDDRQRLPWSRADTTDQNGEFQLRGVAPGRYQVTAWEDIDPGALFDEEFTSRFVGRAVRLSVAGGGQASTQLTAVPKRETEALDSK